MLDKRSTNTVGFILISKISTPMINFSLDMISVVRPTIFLNSLVDNSSRAEVASYLFQLVFTV